MTIHDQLFVIPEVVIGNPLSLKNKEALDPRVKPEDDNPKWLFLFVIPEVVIGNPLSLKTKEALDPRVKPEDDNP
jgi:hypothetical protein